MPSDKIIVENLLRAYLLEENILKDRIDSAKFDFGFIISFPPGPKSQSLSICKLKKINAIFITIRFQISKEKAKILNSLKDNKKLQFFNELRKYLLIKEVFFKLDFQNLIVEISEQIYPDEKSFISKNSLFKLIHKVFYCYVFSNLLLEEYCTENKRPATNFGLF